MSERGTGIAKQFSSNIVRALFGSAFAVYIAACGAEPASEAERAGDVQELTGELTVLSVDYADGSAETRFELLTEIGADAARFELLFDDAPELATGDRVRVVGRDVGSGFFEVERYELLAESAPAPAAEIGVSAQALTGNGIRTRSKLAVLMVHWGTPNSMTATEMRNRLFGNTTSTRAYYRETSYGLVELEGDVFGWYQVPAMTGCNYTALAQAARTAATNAGVALSSYQQILYYFPQTSQCQWSGLAYIGRPTAPQRDSFYNGASSCTVLAHELLHNFGARHARAYECGSATVAAPTSCTHSEYGDPYDVMGSGCYHTSAYNKAAQGWFGGCNGVTATADGVFAIAPTELASNALQTLRIPMSSALCPAGLSPCYYYLEYRQPLGLFDAANPNAQVHSGVLVHVAGPTDFTGRSSISSPYLLDLTPGSQSSDFRDPVLTLGRTYQEPNGVAFTVEALTAQAATVRVRFPNGGSGAPLCSDGTTYGGSTNPPPPPPPPPPPTTTCPSGTMEYGGHCYALTTTTASYDSSRNACQQRGSNWRLAAIESAAENQFVAGLAGSREVWVGGNDRTTEGAWVWEATAVRFWNGGVTGAAPAGVYANFRSDEPNGGSTSDCARMVSGGTWRDGPCGSRYRAVCESM